MIDPSSLLRSLLALPNEIEYVEFKHNNADPKELGQQISSISNAACLSEVDMGYLVYGVEDETRKPLGTTFHPQSTKMGNEDLELWLNKQLDPDLNFEIIEFNEDGKCFAIFKIPACMRGPVKFQGQAYIRVGSNKRSLNDYRDREAAIWNKSRDRDFESGTAVSGLDENDVLNLIDYPAYFTLLQKPLPKEAQGILDELAAEHFIKLIDPGSYAITNLGALLFAKDITRFPSLKRKAVRIIVYGGVDKTRTIREKEEVRGYGVSFEDIISFINDQLPSNEEIQRALRVEKKVYPEIAIRELVANALIHQDLTLRGTGPAVEIFNDRIEISNPGSPLIQVDRFLDHKPQSRNEDLAAFMRRLRICEERGSGIDKVFINVEIFQLPAPKFDAQDAYLSVTLFSFKSVKEMSKEDRIRACFQHACLKFVLNASMTNSSLRERFKLEDGNSSSVFISGIITDTLQADMIKPLSVGQPRKSARYVPYWA